MSTDTETGPGPAAASGGHAVLTTLAWAWVVIPFLYGVWQLLIRIPALF